MDDSRDRDERDRNLAREVSKELQKNFELSQLTIEAMHNERLYFDSLTREERKEYLEAKREAQQLLERKRQSRALDSLSNSISTQYRKYLAGELTSWQIIIINPLAPLGSMFILFWTFFAVNDFPIPSTINKGILALGVAFTLAIASFVVLLAIRRFLKRRFTNLNILAREDMPVDGRTPSVQPAPWKKYFQ